MDASNVTNNIRETAACPPDHTIEVLTPSEAVGSDGAHDDDFPAFVRHESPGGPGKVASITPIRSDHWKSIVEGDNDAVDNIKKLIKAAHSQEDFARNNYCV